MMFVGGFSVGTGQAVPEFSGGPFYVELYGSNFGKANGTISLCSSLTDPCNGNPDLPDLRVTMSPPYPWWRPDGAQVNVLLTPSPSAAGTYYVELASLGA